MDAQYLSDLYPIEGFSRQVVKQVPIYKDRIDLAIRYYNSIDCNLAYIQAKEVAKRIKGEVVEIEEHDYKYRLENSDLVRYRSFVGCKNIELVKTMLENIHNKRIVWIGIENGND